MERNRPVKARRARRTRPMVEPTNLNLSDVAMRKLLVLRIISPDRCRQQNTKHHTTFG